MLKPLLAFFLMNLAVFGAVEELWPGAKYDPAVPTAKQVLGFDLGERIAWSAQSVQYLEALAKATPRKMKLWDYGKTWEGRRLVYAVIGSEANIARLDQIKTNLKRLGDAR